MILIDDADRAENSVVPHLTRLAKLEPSPQPRLTLILAGDRLMIGRLGSTLLGLSELRIDLAAWQPDDIAGYLDSTLRQAGGSASMFDEPAIERLYELSQGIPRQVRLLADLSLVAGAGRHLHSIDANVVSRSIANWLPSKCRVRGARSATKWCVSRTIFPGANVSEVLISVRNAPFPRSGSPHPPWPAQNSGDEAKIIVFRTSRFCSGVATGVYARFRL